MRWIIFALPILFAISNCTKDANQCDGENVSYDSQIKTIFERACNNGTCHPGAIDGWRVLPFFDSYENTLPLLKNGLITERLFHQDSNLLMPPIRYKERELTDEELRILTCWLDNEYPKN